MKLALVCDWLTAMRGGERCLEAACTLYPRAEIYTLVHEPGRVSPAIESHPIHTSYIQRLPGDTHTFRRYLPLFHHAIQRFDLSGYDAVLSFSHCVAKDVRVPAGIPHICYCHTPMRYAWTLRDAYLQPYSHLQRSLAEAWLNYMQRQDRQAAQGVTHFVANSHHVRQRIEAAYGRTAEVLYPPIDLDRFSVTADHDGTYLVVSALVPYKRIDLAVLAFKGWNRRLRIVGHGPEQDRLRSMASDNIEFIEQATDAEVAGHYQRCRALIFPGLEDFGMVPLEVQACGKPVIAFGRGGALETVRAVNHPSDAVVPEQATGLFFFEQHGKALRQAIHLFETQEATIRPTSCRHQAERFSRHYFVEGLQRIMTDWKLAVSE